MKHAGEKIAAYPVVAGSEDSRDKIKLSKDQPQKQHSSNETWSPNSLVSYDEITNNSGIRLYFLCQRDCLVR